MKAVVVDSDNASTWVPKITNFGKNLDLLYRCAQAEVEAGNLEATYPGEDLVHLFAYTHDAFAVALVDDETVVGYVLSSAEGYVKWAGIQTGYESHWGTLLDLVRARYGAVWGRVTNSQMRNDIIANVDYIVLRFDDDQVIGDF